MSQNRAAWITSEKATPLQVDDAPMPKPGPGEVVFKNHAVAVNPIDWKIQTTQFSTYVQTYPFILGLDAAGIIEEVGPDVTHFQKGDRVIANLPSLSTTNPRHSAYQLYPLTPAHLTARIPDSLSFEQAVVLPLGISTAAAGLYLPGYLGLELPSHNANTNTNPDSDTGKGKKKKTLLIWGGSSSVGATAIQLARASGLNVITTASVSNFAFVREMGAAAVFDYQSQSVVEDIVRQIQGDGGEFVGIYDAISEEGKSLGPLAGILEGLGLDKAGVKIAGVLPVDGNKYGVESKFIFALDIAKPPHEHIGKAIWGDFVPNALANGRLQAKPDPLVAGKGLEDIQHAMNVQMNGVSAKKVVVSIP